MSTRGHASLLAAVVLWATACAAPGPAPPAVVLVLLDAARPDRFSCYGYTRETTPHLDALASRGALFLRHYTHGPNTRTAVPSLLRSRYFTTPMLAVNRTVPLEDPRMLFRRVDAAAISLPRAFAAAGYRTAAISAHTWTHAGTPFAREFDELYDLPGLVPYDLRVGYPTAGQVVDAALDWIDRQRSPFFLYLHLMDTHFPHLLGPEARALLGDTSPTGRFDARGAPRDPERALTPAERRELDARYDGSLQHADRELGRLVAALERTRPKDRLVLAVTSDHGEHLLEQPGRLEHRGPLLEPLARVPLILFGRGIPLVHVDGLSEAVDLMPTLLDAAGVELPPGATVDGRSLLPVLRGEEKARGFVYGPFHLVGGRHKLLFTDARVPLGRAGSAGGVALYDLERDPNELHDRADAEPARVAELVATYRERMAEPWRRFEEARRDGPPDFPFAVAATDFDTPMPVPELSGFESRAELARVVAAHGWLRSRHLWRHVLLGRPRAAALEIAFPVPNGTYRLAASVRGALRLRVGGAGETVVRGLPVDEHNPWAGEPVEVGPVTVSANRFRATVAPVGSEPMALKYLSFVPVGVPAQPAEEEARAIERLRTLGYVH